MTANRMTKKTYLETLATFVVGDTSLETLQEAIEEALLDLQESRRPSEEKSWLSKLDLVLHEVRENAREPFDAYALALTMLEHSLREPVAPERRSSDTSYAWFRLPASRRAFKHFEFDSESDKPAEHHSLPLAESRA